MTEVVPLDTFHPAEAYHQDYFENDLGQRYCQIIIVRKEFLERLKR